MDALFSALPDRVDEVLVSNVMGENCGFAAHRQAA